MVVGYAQFGTENTYQWTIMKHYVGGCAYRGYMFSMKDQTRLPDGSQGMHLAGGKRGFGVASSLYKDSL